MSIKIIRRDIGDYPVRQQNAVPAHGKSPVPPYFLHLKEVREVAGEALKENAPENLQSGVETKITEKGWHVLFTPLYACMFQAIELLQAEFKNDTAAIFEVGKAFREIIATFARHSRRVNCTNLVRHAEDCMDIWIANDRVISVSIRDLEMTEMVREQLASFNPKFLTEEELKQVELDEDSCVNMTVVDEGGAYAIV